MPKAKGHHRVHRLTAVAVRNAKGPAMLSDGGGLWLQVGASGSKSWLLITAVRGKRPEIGLGSVSDVSLAEARELAQAMRKIARSGGDPRAERNRWKSGIPSFETAAKTIHVERKDGWRNAKHRAQWINTLTTYAFPVIGNMPVDKIETPNVLSVLSPIWQSKSETARRVKQRISSVFDWAIAAGHRQTPNPVAGVTKGLARHGHEPLHHPAMLATDVAEFVGRLRQFDAGTVVKLALEFLILTAGRTAEVLKAEWAEIDEGNKLWTIPASRMKAKKPHNVPLSDRALEILAEARKLNDSSPFVFPGLRRGKPLSQMALLMLMRRMERKEVPHGFRSTFRIWCAERTSFPREVAEAALAHVIKNKAERAYQRSDLLEKRRKLMTTWAAWCAPKGAKVVTLRAG